MAALRGHGGQGWAGAEDDRFSEQQTAAPVSVSQLWQWRGPGSISSWGLAADAVARLVIQ